MPKHYSMQKGRKWNDRKKFIYKVIIVCFMILIILHIIAYVNSVWFEVFSS